MSARIGYHPSLSPKNAGTTYFFCQAEFFARSANIFQPALNYQHSNNEIFDSLIKFGEDHFNDIIKIDYFAVSLPDMQVFDTDPDQKNQIHCLYMQGLGYLGKGSEEDIKKAASLFANVLKLDVNHQGALAHQRIETNIENA